MPCPLLAPFLTAAAQAQGLSSRPATIVSPYMAGGTSHIIARVLGEGLNELWKQPVLIENRLGANGSIGVSAVARSAPDGHTLLAVASSALTLNPLLYRKLSYDVERDLVDGQVDLMFDNPPTVLEPIRGCQLRALAATSASRSPFLPDVPAIAEMAIPGFDTSAWFAVLAPRATPPELLPQLEQAVTGILAQPAISTRLAAAGVTLAAAGSAELAGRIERDRRLRRR